MDGNGRSRAARWRTLGRLFFEMCFVSTFVLGGGYVILSVADERFSRRFPCVRRGELFEMLPLFQMVPGIIGVHTAIFLGSRIAGLPGALVALAAVALPSVLVFTAVSLAYAVLPVGHPLLQASFLGLRAALTGLLCEIALRTAKTSAKGAFGIVAFAVSLAAMTVCAVPPGRLIVSFMAFGVAFLAVRERLSPSPGASRTFGTLWAIPLLFMGYGLIAFGGGFVLIPVYFRDFVGAAAPYLNLDPADFANVMALTEMTPGPVAVNCATFFGYRMGHLPGALAATVSLLLPGSAILLLALRSIERFRSSLVVRGVFLGVRPVALAMIASAAWSFAGISVWHSSAEGLCFSPTGAVLAAATLFASLTRRLGAVTLILLCAFAALAVGFLCPAALSVRV